MLGKCKFDSCYCLNWSFKVLYWGLYHNCMMLLASSWHVKGNKSSPFIRNRFMHVWRASFIFMVETYSLKDFDSPPMWCLVFARGRKGKIFNLYWIIFVAERKFIQVFWPDVMAWTITWNSKMNPISLDFQPQKPKTNKSNASTFHVWGRRRNWNRERL